MNLESKAWNLLLEEEKTALKLQLGLGKSGWEASEIMSRAHYKYLEIKQRGEKFFKMFSEHFDYYSDQLIPEDIISELSPGFIEYIEKVIVQRKTINEAFMEMAEDSFLVPEIREKIIIRNMELLRESQKLPHKSLYNIILDFDRWNNFRILPKSIQEPHAFKRRNKNRSKKYLKNLTSLKSFVIHDVVEHYEVTPSSGTLFMPIPGVTLDNSRIVSVSRTEDVVGSLSSMGFFLFVTIDQAREFLTLVVNYCYKEEKHCTDGQKFWPRFRTLSELAYNYRNLEKIVPDRKYLNQAITRVSQKK